MSGVVGDWWDNLSLSSGGAENRIFHGQSQKKYVAFYSPKKKFTWKACQRDIVVPQLVLTPSASREKEPVKKKDAFGVFVGLPIFGDNLFRRPEGQPISCHLKGSSFPACFHNLPPTVLSRSRQWNRNSDFRYPRPPRTFFATH